MHHPLPPPLRRSGVALVIVLGMLVLVAVLVIAFLSSVGTELKSAKSYASGSDARQLADSAVNIVISQIQDATTTPSLAWASQPGMIRTYDNQGAAKTAYKLYSSGQLQVANGFNAPASLGTEIPTTWAAPANADLYTDLNKPVTVGATPHYPIISPAAVNKDKSYDSSAPATLAPLDPSSSSPVEGCFLDTTQPAVAVTATQTNPVPMPVQWLYVLKDGSVHAIDPATKKIAGAGATLPDGTQNTITGRVAFWTDDETCKVNVNTASEGTFWGPPMTNGAPAAGTFPNITSTSYEQTLNLTSPVQNEFQRYPGHPAMTCLSPIFPPLASELNPDGTTKDSYKERIYGNIPRVTGGGSLAGTTNVNGTSAPLVPDNQRLFASVDEFLFGTTTDASGARQANPSGSASKFTQDDIEKTRFFLTATSRAPEVNLFNKPRITLWPLQANTANISDPANATNRNAKDKLIAFCSTIGSGANAKPYYFQRYNTFNGSARAANGSYDPGALQNPIPSSQSPSMDWTLIPRNQQIFSYLQSLIKSPIPGLGGNLAGAGGKYSAAVGDQILTEMMDYLRSSINTYHNKSAAAVSTDTPYYSYVPYAVNGAGAASGWVTGQGQVVPLVITPPGAGYQTKGFGRFSTITQATLVFYRTDKLQYVPNPAQMSNKPPTYNQDVPKDLPDTFNTTPTFLTGKITVLDYTPGTPLSIPIITEAVPSTWTGSPPDSPFVVSGKTIPLKVPTMRAVLLLQTFNVTPGMPPWNGNFRVRVTGLDALQIKTGGTTAPLGFSSPATNLVDGYGEANYYDTTALTQFEVSTEYYPNNKKTLGLTSPGSSTEEKFYPFCSNPVTLTGPTFDIVGANITVEIYSGCSSPNGINPSDLVQTINMTVPSTSSSLPIPNVIYGASYMATAPTPNPNGYVSDTTIGSSANSKTDYDARLAELGYNSNNAPHNHRNYIQGDVSYRGDTVRSVQARYGFAGGGGDYRLIAGLPNVPASFFEGHGLIDPSTDGMTYNDTTVQAKTLHSLRTYPSTGSNDDKSNGFYSNGNNTTGMTYISPTRSHGKLVSSAAYFDPIVSGGARPCTAPVAAQGMMGAFMDAARTKLGDWDTGPGIQIDGPYINKADEGNSGIGWMALGSYQTAGTVVDTGASFSPNRQISSAIAFGSLPSGIDPSNPANSTPWQTLLFCKNPAAGLSHPGFGKPVIGTPPYTTPPDNAFLDLFTMPIVEPYAISDPFSTAGKVNMNYQMVPFTYLTRDTGVRAVLKSTLLMAINTNCGQNYKANPYDTQSYPTFPSAPDFRYTLNLDETTGTLAGFQQRFTSGDIFRSASEICDIYLVPKYLVNTSTLASPNPQYSTMAAWWLGASMASTNGYKLTGDNVREQPYGHIYPRLTTKSNTYTVHVMAQSIKKLKSTPVDQFVDGKDVVTGEFRGSFIVERYLDPNSDSLVHADGKTPASETDPDAMVGPYKFRIVSSKRFAP